MKVLASLLLVMAVSSVHAFAPSSKRSSSSQARSMSTTLEPTTTGTTINYLDTLSPSLVDNLMPEAPMVTVQSVPETALQVANDLLQAAKQKEHEAELVRRELSKFRAEQTARGLLTAHLAYEQQERAMRAEQALEQARVHAERTSRGLLTAHLAYEQQNRHMRAEQALEQATLHAEQTARGLLTARLAYEQQARIEQAREAAQLKAEQTSRGLLTAHLAYEQQERAVRAEERAFQASVKAEQSARALLEAKLALDRQDRLARSKLHAEKTARALLSTHLELERQERVHRAELEAQRLGESKQRALLSYRLAAQEHAYNVYVEQRERVAARRAAIEEARRQPKSAEDEAAMAKRYAAIANLEERAFAILVDLGMVEPTSTESDL